MIMLMEWYTALYPILGIIILKVYFKLSTGWCKSQVCLIGKTVIVTGANAGIGYQTALDLAKRGAKVILACRNKQRAEEACLKIRNETHNPNVFVKLVDFSSFESVRKFATDINETEKDWHILVNNAGIAESKQERSQDGCLMIMQTNYYSSFLLTNLLLEPVLKNGQNTGPRRIVNVSSIVARYTWLNLKKLDTVHRKEHLYNRSKLCNIFFTIELDARLRKKGTTHITTYSVHPGIIKTGLARQMLDWKLWLYPFYRNEIEGAQTTIHCAVADGIEAMSGEHFHDCDVVGRYYSASSREMPGKLWNETEKIVKMC